MEDVAPRVLPQPGQPLDHRAAEPGCIGHDTFDRFDQFVLGSAPPRNILYRPDDTELIVDLGAFGGNDALGLLPPARFMRMFSSRMGMLSFSRFFEVAARARVLP